MNSGAWGADPAPEPPVSQAKINTQNGDFTVAAFWSSDPEDGESVLEATVSFMPNNERFPACSSLKMIQTAHLTVADGSNYVWDGGEINRNLMETPGGVYIDHDASKCKKGAACSPYFRDSWANPEGSQNGYAQGAGRVASVSLRDYPVGWENFNRIALESCRRPEADHHRGHRESAFELFQTGARAFSPLLSVINYRTGFFIIIVNFSERVGQDHGLSIVELCLIRHALLN